LSAPFLWIGIPAVASIVLFTLRKRTVPILVAGGLISLLMAWLAWQFPIDTAVSFGPLSVKITQTMNVFGRGFSITDAYRPFIALLFISSACWYFGGLVADPGDYFGPAAMAILSLLIAAIAVEPFLYAALLIELAVLISIPLLAPPRQLAGRGVFRFLSFQTFGMPFILFTGWLLTGVSASPSDVGLVVTASILLGVGFAFILGVFPFHSWMPMLAEQSQPYASSFLFYFFPGIISIFALGFLDRYVWLRETQTVFILLQWVGVVMVFFGGLWAAFQTHLGKVFGFAAMMEIGFALISIGLDTSDGLALFFAMWIPRLVAYIAWAISLSILYRENDGDLSFSHLKRSGGISPYILFTIIIAQLSLAGMPPLAGYPLRIALWQSLAGVSVARAVIVLVGAAGLLVATTRTISLLNSSTAAPSRPVMQNLQQWLSIKDNQQSLQEFLVLLFSTSILMMQAWFPHWFYAALASLPHIFEQLGMN
jgi:NADH-quinone oxidoreductase subunit N